MTDGQFIVYAILIPTIVLVLIVVLARRFETEQLTDPSWASYMKALEHLEDR